MTRADWQRRRITAKLEAGGAIVALRQKGYTWADLAAAFGLGDHHEARKLAVNYLLAAAGPRSEAQAAAATDPAADDDRSASEAG